MSVSSLRGPDMAADSAEAAHAPGRLEAPLTSCEAPPALCEAPLAPCQHAQPEGDQQHRDERVVGEHRMRRLLPADAVDETEEENRPDHVDPDTVKPAPPRGREAPAHGDPRG